MKVIRDNGKKFETIFNGSEKECQNYVFDILAKNEYKYLIFTDINMRSVFEIYEGKFGPKSFCIFFK